MGLVLPCRCSARVRMLGRDLKLYTSASARLSAASIRSVSRTSQERRQIRAGSCNTRANYADKSARSRFNRENHGNLRKSVPCVIRANGPPKCSVKIGAEWRALRNSPPIRKLSA